MTTSALALSCLLALAAWGMEVRAATHHHPTDNKHEDAIEEFQEILQNQVRNDFLELEEKFNDLVEDINLTLESLQTYTNESIEELRKHTLDNMVERDQHLDNNMVSFESYITDKIEELNSTMKENFDKLNELSEGERHTIVGWIHQRTHSHEDILKSEIGLCAYDNGHEGVGVVTYNSGTHSAGYVGGTKKWRVFNTTHPDLCCKGPGQGDDCEDCAMKVLNRQTGYFTVPQNAAGLYMFTFSVTMDTFDDYKLLPKEYKFEKNGHLLDDGLMGIYADAGSNRANDKVPGSRTILLRLEDGDQVAVRQTRADGLDGQILFCGALLHLKKVHEFLCKPHFLTYFRCSRLSRLVAEPRSRHLSATGGSWAWRQLATTSQASRTSLPCPPLNIAQETQVKAVCWSPPTGGSGSWQRIAATTTGARYTGRTGRKHVKP